MDVQSQQLAAFINSKTFLTPVEIFGPRHFSPSIQKPDKVMGPRASQRHVFNNRVPDYPYLRLNGLDSQSCFECHNSIGSASIDARGALMRKAPGTAGSAGSNRQSEQLRAGTNYHLLGAMRRIEERDRERFSQPPNEEILTP
jgi:hypothetical protein